MLVTTEDIYKNSQVPETYQKRHAVDSLISLLWLKKGYVYSMMFMI